MSIGHKTIDCQNLQPYIITKSQRCWNFKIAFEHTILELEEEKKNRQRGVGAGGQRTGAGEQIRRYCQTVM
jgi:hypothetical protein